MGLEAVAVPSPYCLDIIAQREDVSYLAQLVSLRLVEKDAPLFRTRSVLTRPEGYTGDTRFVIGSDPLAPDLICGRCSSALVTGAIMAPYIVFQCGSCRAFNDNTPLEENGT
jgi:hypothetical protein